MNEQKQGIVIKSTGNIYWVRCQNENISCVLRGKFRTKGIKTTNPIAVGDYVVFSTDDKNNHVITQILDRKNFIYRKSTNLSKITHIIAANIDRVFLIVSMVEPCTPLGFIDRFLVSAEAFRIPATIVFNKCDIYNQQAMKQTHQLIDIYQSIGYQCIITSAITEKGLSLLAKEMKNQVSLFVGQSGVGKSSLINSIEPSLQLKIRDISNYNEKGKHTTTFTQMHNLQMGGFIIDSPGIKEFGLIQYQKTEICHYFPEMLKLLDQCYFSNCSHTHEPNCAVKQAVKEGKIAMSRYNNYLSIINDEDINLKDWMLK